MNEQWLKWIPIQTIPYRRIWTYFIRLKEWGKKVKIVFKYSVHAYRSTDESFRQKTIFELSNKYGEKFIAEWSLFKVRNSEYIQWLLEQSYEIIESESLIHFVFVALDSIFEVIAAYEPKIESEVVSS